MPEYLIPFLPFPDGITIAILLVVTIFIYYFLPEEMKYGARKIFATYGVYILLFLLWLYFRNKWGIVAENETIGQMKLATFMFLLGCLIYFAVVSWLYEFRYYTNHAVANNRHGSCHRYQEVGDWIILFIGGSGSSDQHFVIPWPYVKEIWVVPRVSVQFLGNQIFVLTQLEKVETLDLPEEELENAIVFDVFGKWAKHEVYFGIAPEKIKAIYPQYHDLQSLLMKQGARINELKNMLKGKLNTTKTFVSDTLGMTDKFRGKSWKSSAPPEE